ncbi:MAG TPA: alpha/beta hydrolase domain-containing protein, partial [Candidatus Binataceae bacterium]|nr:alpha/beta hydrolase domain-containing protein [Candidatus Binataceae bacterium]
TLLTNFDRAAASLNPHKLEEFGDGFLLNEGYTLLWVGWQFDVSSTPELVRLYPPMTQGVKGIVRAEVLVEKKETSSPLAPYRVINAEDPELKLTVRDGVEGHRETIPRGEWHIDSANNLVLNSGFEPGRIYELVYSGENPPVAGTGFAAIRDMISWLKYGGNVAGAPADAARLQRAYSYGASQSGRFLRSFLYFGFNRDEKNRKVFEGVFAERAGAGVGSFNQRFAQPNRATAGIASSLYPADIFPFTDYAETDPETGMKDGLLAHMLPQQFWPRVFYTNSSTEYYDRAASLVHTSLDGKSDVSIPPTTRIYFYSGAQHGPGAFPPVRRGTQNLANPNPYTWSHRALLIAMDNWVKNGKEPPASQYARIKDHQLVPPSELNFPKIPGIAFPMYLHRAYPSNYGPEFRSKGIATQEPPELGKPYPTLLPQVDADGNDIAGIRMPEIQAPLATYTGWNLRAKEIGAPDQLYALVGSYIPFARTKADRMKSSDPRLSIEERYSSKEEYLAKFEQAAKSLASQGYLLTSDVPALVQRGGAEWDLAHQ